MTDAIPTSWDWKLKVKEDTLEALAKVRELENGWADIQNPIFAMDKPTCFVFFFLLSFISIDPASRFVSPAKG